MDLTWEQGRGRETQVQPPLEVWRQFFGVPDIYGTLPSFSLVNRRALDSDEPVRPAVLHDHNATIEIAGAIGPRPAILRMVQMATGEYEYIVYRPGMTNFDVFDSLLDEVENPLQRGQRRWFIAPKHRRDGWPLVAAELQEGVRERIAERAREDEIAAARSMLAELAGQSSEGQGYESFTPRRKAIEDHAMSEATAYYEREGWDVTDVSRRRSYDLLCRRGEEVLHVEVKGTTSSGAKVLLTRNEVEHARGTFPEIALFVVSGIGVSGDPPRASGGSSRVISPWDVEQGSLVELAFEYELPPG
ncbi:MAG: DUF3883 domain-containing protein [Actinomycetota bacterium]|nr:DUF3883 domain-containing protein [Actinomycetota bacterium]